MNKLSWENVCVETKEGKRLINDASGSVFVNRLCVFMGPSGSGKTTLLRTILGHVPSTFITSGRILIDDKPVNKSLFFNSSFEEQDDHYEDETTVFDFIYESCIGKNRDKDDNEIRSRINFLLKKMHIFEKRINRLDEVSGGERKRVMVVLAIMCDEKIIVLDEPTSGLDSHLALELTDFLKSIKGKIMIISMHQPGILVQNMIDDIVFIQEGFLLYCGSLVNFEKYLKEEAGIVTPKNVPFIEFVFLLGSDWHYSEEVDMEKHKFNMLKNRKEVTKIENSGKNRKVNDIRFSSKIIYHLLKRYMRRFTNSVDGKTSYIVVYFQSLIFSLLLTNISVINYLKTKKVTNFFSNSAVIFPCAFFASALMYNALRVMQGKLMMKHEIKKRNYTVIEFLFSRLIILYLLSIFQIYISYMPTFIVWYGVFPRKIFILRCIVSQTTDFIFTFSLLLILENETYLQIISFVSSILTVDLAKTGLNAINIGEKLKSIILIPLYLLPSNISRLTDYFIGEKYNISRFDGIVDKRVAIILSLFYISDKPNLFGVNVGIKTCYTCIGVCYCSIFFASLALFYYLNLPSIRFKLTGSKHSIKQ